MLRSFDPIEAVREGRPLAEPEAIALAQVGDLARLTSAAAAVRDAAFGDRVTYSRKVFVPLTHLCRDVCHYCTFAHPPRKGERAFMTLDEVLKVARQGAAAGCREVLFTLGDKPELRYRRAAEELEAMGFASTLDYLHAAAETVLRETGLVPHLNPGVMTREELERLRTVSGSMGIMVESTSERLSRKGGPHWGSPDKHPAVRLATLRAAGEARVPFTTGILIGIGETRAERIEALLAIRAIHAEHGHIQEVIVQNFRAKPDTRMRDHPEPSLEDLLWTIAIARLILPTSVSVQAPPNLSPGVLARLVDAGIDDWGGVSPVTPDFVNPEAPWPHLDALARETRAAGKELCERLTVYPGYALAPEGWLDRRLAPVVLRSVDAEGLARTDGEWSTGAVAPPPAADLAAIERRHQATARPATARIIERAEAGEALDEDDIVRLFAARGEDFAAVCGAADRMRRDISGDAVTYVVNRNINYTNVCYFRCQFCAFSKGKLSENLRGKPYVLPLDEIARRAVEAWERGATEVCLQGGIHPAYTGDTYIEIVQAVKAAVPGMHVHAFSPLEVAQGAATLGLDVPVFLERLKAVGLDTLPGTAAEVLDDEVRRIICPDKLTTDLWLDGMRAAHAAGLRTTSTIMFGHVDRPVHWARHLIRLRDLQAETGGFTEFVPLPFVAEEAPLYLKGRARHGPSFREAVLMHAVARLVFGRLIPNVQTSWVKMGPEGVLACLAAGANDLGGTLMNETITRSAGAAHGEELEPQRMDAIIRGMGRAPVQRTTDYGTPPEAQVRRSHQAPPLTQTINPEAKDYARAEAPAVLVRPGFG